MFVRYVIFLLLLFSCTVVKFIYFLHHLSTLFVKNRMLYQFFYGYIHKSYSQKLIVLNSSLLIVMYVSSPLSILNKHMSDVSRLPLALYLKCIEFRYLFYFSDFIFQSNDQLCEPIYKIHI